MAEKTFSVIYPHTSQSPDPICLQVGDFVQVGEMDAEYPGWVWVTTVDGNQGWAPIQYLEFHKYDGNVKILQSYTAKELTTKENEILMLHYELNQWGWMENEHQETGWVPMKTLSLRK